MIAAAVPGVHVQKSQNMKKIDNLDIYIYAHVHVNLQGLALI